MEPEAGTYIDDGRIHYTLSRILQVVYFNIVDGKQFNYIYNDRGYFRFINISITMGHGHRAGKGVTDQNKKIG
jgi:hypothetical protein